MHQRSSFVLVNWIQTNGQAEAWPGQIQFFVEHLIKLLSGIAKIHHLAYVRWYKQVRPADDRFNLSAEGLEKRCMAELWSWEFTEESVECWVLMHRFYAVSFQRILSCGKAIL